MTNLNEKTMVPLQWVLVGTYIGGGAILGGVVLACSWVFAVNARLARIENKLGISQPIADTQIIHNAEASEK